MQILVTPQWLVNNKEKLNIIILDATLKKTVNINDEISTEVIPGAIYFDLENSFSNLNTNIPHTFPLCTEMASSLANIGVTSNSTIVVYDQQGAYSAPRVWWMLKVMGIKNVYLLNGGISSWKELGLDTSFSHSEPISSTIFQPFNFQAEQVIDKTAVVENIKSDRFIVIDARSSARFNGTQAEPRSGLRSGHIPGALNIPFSDVLQGSQYKSVEEIAKIFEKKGLKKSDNLVFSCGSGVTACIVLLAAYLVGYKVLGVYDGSWTEWALDTNLSVE